MRKKVLSLVLSLILAVSSVVPSYATDLFGDGIKEEINQGNEVEGTVPSDVIVQEEIDEELFDDGLEGEDYPSEEDISNNEGINEVGENILTATEGDYEYEIINDKARIIKYNGSDVTVEIPSTLGGYPVTHIGKDAFWQYSFLESVSLPSGLTSIENYAFGECINLKEISLPESLISIGNGAFNQCTNLKEMVLPNKLESIGNYAFMGCTGLNYIYLPDSLTYLGSSVFVGCGLLNNVVLPNNLTTIESSLFLKCESLSNVHLPDSLTSIGYSAFAYTGLDHIDLPDSLTSIGRNAFTYTGLKYIDLPDSLTSIESSAFAYTSLDHIDLPNGLTTIENGVFNECRYLKSVKLPNNLTSIGDEAFEDCIRLNEIEFPDSLISIGKSAFSRCEELYNVVLPKNLKTINYYTFGGCVKLNHIYIPPSVTDIVLHAFAGCDNLTIYGESGSYAEKYATELGIPFYSFVPGDENNQVKDFEYKVEGNEVIILNYLGNNQDVVIPSTIEGYPVTHIESLASFGSVDHLRSVFVPESIIDIGALVFLPSDNFAIWGYPGSYAESFANSFKIQFVPYYHAEDITDFEFQIEGNEITILKYIGSSRYVVMPSVIDGYRVTRIEDKAFFQNRDVSQLEMPFYLKSIGNSAFEQCTNLSLINLPKYLTDIGTNSFYSCTKLTEIEVPDSVINIGSHSFYNCTTLFNVILPANLKTIESSLFESCTNLSSITIPEHVENIEDRAFYNCSSLEKVTIQEGVTYISDDVFEGCNPDLAIHGYAGSYSESYAEEHNIDFVMLNSLNVYPSFEFQADEKKITWFKNKYSEEKIDIYIDVFFSAPVTIKQIDIKLDRLNMFKVDGSNRETNDGDIYTYSLDKNEIINGKGTFQVTLVKKGLLSWWKPKDADLHEGHVSVVVTAERDNGAQLTNNTNTTKDLTVFYQNQDKVDDAEKKAEKESENNSDNSTDIALKEFDNIDNTITLDNDIETEIGKNQFQALKLLIYTEISLANISKSYFTSAGLSDKIAEKIMSKYLGYEKPVFGISDKTVPIQVVVQGDNKKQYQFELMCEVQMYDVKGTNFGMNGRIETQMWEVSAPNKKIRRINCDLGMVNEAKLGEFANGVWEVAKSSLQSAYNNIWGNDANKGANNISEDVIDSMASMAAKYGLEKPVQLILKKFYEKKLKGKFSEKFFQLLIYPSKLAVAQCPVDIYVYNGNNLVGSIIEDQVSLNGEGVALWTEGDDKYIQLFDDTYQIRYVSNGTGTMTLNIYDQMLNNINYRKCEFLRIPLEVGKAYNQTVNNELLTNAENYNLTSDQGEILIVNSEDVSSSDVYPDSHTHVWDTGVVTKKASCVETGILTYSCFCGETKTEEIPMISHTYGDWTITKQATVYEEGEKQRVCIVCGNIQKEIIPKLQYNPNQTTTPTPNLTPSPGATVTPTPGTTITPSPTATVTPIPTVTATPTPELTLTPIPPEVTPEPTPSLATPDLKVSSVLGTRKVVFNWEPVAEADGYQIVRWNPEKGKFVGLKTILSSSGKLSYEKLLSFGKSYTFRIRAFKLADDNITRIFGEYGDDITISVPQYSKWEKPKVVASTKTGNMKVYLSWNRIDDANGYKIYLYNKNEGKYNLVNTIVRSNITSYILSGLSPATRYAFRVRSYAINDDGSQINGKISSVAKVITPPRQISKVTISSSSGNPVISWEKISGAKGYKIYRCSSLNGTYKAIKTLTNGRAVTFADLNAVSGSTYYYKVRAFSINPDGSRSYGKLSVAKEVKIK